MTPIDRLGIPAGFTGIWIPCELWTRTDMLTSEKVVISVINSLDRGDGCFASDSYIANFCGLSRGALSNILSSLRSRGIVETTEYDGRNRRLKQCAFSITSKMTPLHPQMNTTSPTDEVRLNPQVKSCEQNSSLSILEDNELQDSKTCYSKDYSKDINTIQPELLQELPPPTAPAISPRQKKEPKPSMPKDQMNSFIVAFMALDKVNPAECTNWQFYCRLSRRLWDVNHDITAQEIHTRMNRLKAKYAWWDSHTSAKLVSHWGELHAQSAQDQKTSKIQFCN